MKEKKEESPPPDDDDDKDDSVEVIFKMWESCQIEKKEAVPDKKAELETEEVEDSRKVDESDKASSAYVSFFSKEHPIKASLIQLELSVTTMCAP